MALFAPILRWFRGGRTPTPAPGPDEDSFRQIAENSSDLICRIGGDGSAKYFSPASEALFGWKPDEMSAMAPDMFFYAEDLPILDAATKRLLSGASTTELCQVRARHRDGTMRWVETKTSVAPDPAGKKVGDLIVVLRDISDRKRLEEQLARLAMTDGLTGVANRRAFDAALDQGWKDTLAHRGEMSLLLLDIDCFKKFNDHFGHQTGDDCLRAVAAALHGAVGASGSTVARFGGEEFGVVLPGVRSWDAAAIAERLRAAVQDLALPHPANENEAPFVTVSIGSATAMARAGGTMQMPAGLVQAADRALYKAKQNGRNRVETSLLLASDEGG